MKIELEYKDMTKEQLIKLVELLYAELNSKPKNITIGASGTDIKNTKELAKAIYNNNELARNPQPCIGQPFYPFNNPPPNFPTYPQVWCGTSPTNSLIDIKA